MRRHNKKLLIFIGLCSAFLSACGGGASGIPTDNAPITFLAPGIDTPAVTPDITTLGECGALPGQWKFRDLVTGNDVGMTTPPISTFQKNFRKSWGGTTTAYAVWELQSGDTPVWNEGRTVHVGSDTPFTTAGAITSIALTGIADNITVLVGTDRGLVIADITKIQDKWTTVRHTIVETVGSVRSIATNTQKIETGGPEVTMIYLVAQDAVMMAKLDDLRAGFGCVEIAYQAKDHPVDPKDATNTRSFRPIKVVAQHDYAIFLTASRLPEEFANAAQLQTLLQNEWTSFQSSAYLIDLTRKTPVMPFIMTMGKFDRFFASDVAASQFGIFFYGSRYTSANPSAVESGIASYEQFLGTPVVAIWATVPTSLGGNFRMGRFDTNQANAYIRGLDRAAKVEGFLSGPTQQKWSAWKTPLTWDYVRSVNFRLDGNGEMAVETPRYAPSGPLTRSWTTGTDSSITYAPTTAIINATAMDVDYLDVTGGIVHQHVQDDGKAVFSIFDINNTSATANTPRMFHTGDLLFYARHGTNGPSVRVFKDTITGAIDISESGPALIGFELGTASNDTSSSSFGQKLVATFGNMSGSQTSQRIDDIREISNPGLGNLRHFIALVHDWNGKTNNYRAVVLQMNLSPAKMFKRSIEIQGCSDLVNPENNYSGNVSFGKPDDESRFLGPLTATLGPNGAITYSGYFQHFSPTYNVWTIKINVTPEVVPGNSTCKPAGELAPLTDPAFAESLSAVLRGDTIFGLHSNGQVRWRQDSTTTKYLDVGVNILGGAVTVQQGQLWMIAGQYLTRMDPPDGFHPVALFTLDGSSGESCPTCQFTDTVAAGSQLLAAHPERGVELYDFTQ